MVDEGVTKLFCNRTRRNWASRNENLASSWVRIYAGIDRDRLCVGQARKVSRNQFQTPVRRGLAVAPVGLARSAHPTTHPEFVPIEFSSTDLV